MNHVIFFFQGSGTHRNLHSFPTRRSSDLVVFEQLQFRHKSCLPEVEHGREQDRKSTRLNSSHVAISYAVFCLKKKKPRYVSLPGIMKAKKKPLEELALSDLNLAVTTRTQV